MPELSYIAVALAGRKYPLFSFWGRSCHYINLWLSFDANSSHFSKGLKTEKNSTTPFSSYVLNLEKLKILNSAA
jgi:hypothetical protein